MVHDITPAASDHTSKSTRTRLARDASEGAQNDEIAPSDKYPPENRLEAEDPNEGKQLVTDGGADVVQLTCPDCGHEWDFESDGYDDYGWPVPVHTWCPECPYKRVHIEPRPDSECPNGCEHPMKIPEAAHKSIGMMEWTDPEGARRAVEQGTAVRWTVFPAEWQVKGYKCIVCDYRPENPDGIPQIRTDGGRDQPVPVHYGHSEQEPVHDNPECPECGYVIQDTDKVDWRQETLEFGLVVNAEARCPECRHWVEIEIESQHYDAWTMVEPGTTTISDEMPNCPECGSIQTMHLGEVPYGPGEDDERIYEISKCRDCGTTFDSSELVGDDGREIRTDGGTVEPECHHELKVDWARGFQYLWPHEGIEIEFERWCVKEDCDAYWDGAVDVTDKLVPREPDDPEIRTDGGIPIDEIEWIEQDERGWGTEDYIETVGACPDGCRDGANTMIPVGVAAPDDCGPEGHYFEMDVGPDLWVAPETEGQAYQCVVCGLHTTNHPEVRTDGAR